MPRRETPDPTAKAVGQRIRQLRGERGLTAERVAFESELGSKGFLSDIEKRTREPRKLVVAENVTVPHPRSGRSRRKSPLKRRLDHLVRL